MLRIPCMQCLICVSLGDVWGTVFYHAVLFPTAELWLIFFCRGIPPLEFSDRLTMYVEPSKRLASAQVTALGRR